MKVKSRNGIYYDLRQSEYRATCGAMTFYFSSANYRERFYESVQEAISLYNTKQSAKSGIRSAAVFRPAFELYRAIEKRGFYAVVDWLGERYELTAPGDLTIADIPEVIFNAAD